MRNCVHSRLVFMTVPALVAAVWAISLYAQDKVGYLRTRISPREAGVFVNGEYLGTAAMFGHRQRLIKLAPGSHTVEIRDPRYKTLKVDAKISAGQTTTIREYMEPLGIRPAGPFGELTTDGFGNAAIYLNGEYHANPLELQNPAYSLLLKPGE